MPMRMSYARVHTHVDTHVYTHVYAGADFVHVHLLTPRHAALRYWAPS